MNGRVGSLFVMLVLLIGFNVNLIEAENVTGKVNESETGDVEVKVLINESLDFVDEENKTQFNESLDEVNVSIVLKNESAGVENISVESGYEYIDIDELVSLDKDDFGEPEEIEDVEVVKEKVLKELVKNGMVELEFEILEGDDIDIGKKEVKRGAERKDVLISSDEHFDDEVRVYSNLPSPALEEDIVVVWENEGEVVLDVEYFDLDDDGLVDRVSWIVPHLSMQHYSIEIIIGGEESGDELVVEASVPSGVVVNPVVFEFDIDYVNLSDVECSLEIDGDIHLLIEDGDELPKYFDEGTHSWSVECVDKNNISVNDVESGSFEIEDSFDLVVGGFFLKSSGVGGKVYANGGVVELFLVLPNSSEVFLENLSGSFPQDFNVESSKLGDAGSYSLKAISYFYSEVAEIVTSFDLGVVEIEFDGSVDVGSAVSFDIKTDVALGGIYDLYVGTSRIKNNGVFGPGFGSVSSSEYIPLTEGSFDVEAEVTINGVRYDISGGTLVVASGVDDTDPDVELKFPDWEDVVGEDEIRFRYEVDESGGIANCSFKLYDTKEDSSGVHQTDDLIFPISSSDKSLAFEDDLDDGEDVEVRLIDFDEGDYIWEVRCYDDAGNSGWDFNYFSVDFDGNVSKKVSDNEENYSRKDEVEDLIENINSFLEKEDSFGLEERRVLEILGLSADMSFWKKRVVQMDQDLKFNLKFMEESKRVDRIEEIYDEVDEIRDKIILDIRSVDSYEFSKGSVDLDLEEVIGNYMEAEGMSISRSALKSLVSYNEELQKNLGVSVEAWRLELEYIGETREVVLVSKNLDVSGDDLVVLEVIDSKRDVTFVSNVEDVGNNIYSVDASNLEDGNLIYYFEEGFELKEIEDMESVLFGEGASGGLSITGMFTGVGDGLSLGSFFWLPLFLFLGYFGVLAFGRVKLESWKKEPGVEELVRLINETGKLIREGNVDRARDNYNRMGEIYKVLPGKCRDFFYKEIKRVRLAIDKKDVLGLIKEYEAAKDSFRKNDAMVLHGKINAIYRKLPRRFQEKVYRRLVKREV